MKSQLIPIPERISVREDGFCNREKVIPYDIDNIYPQRVLNIIRSSSMGTAVTNLYAKFIEGKGFKDETFAEQKINNQGLKIGSLLKLQTKNYAQLGGIAVHINYNANYEPVEINYLPFEYCRLTSAHNVDHPNMIAIYDDWAMQKRARIVMDKIKYLDKYNPDPAAISQQVIKAGGWDKWNGQVFWYSSHVNEYPLAPCDAVLEDLISDYQAKTFKLRNITTNFMASYMVVTTKKENAADENNLNKLSANEIAFQQTLESFQGGENAGKFLWIQKDSDEQIFDLKKIDIQDVDKLFAFTEKSVADSILRCFGQMPQLLGIVAVNRLGIATELKDATDAYNHRTFPERNLFSKLYKKIFTGFKGNINPSNEWDIMPIEPIEITDDTNSGNIIKLMIDPSLSDDRKKAMLMKVFDYSEDDANAMIVKTIPPAKP